MKQTIITLRRLMAVMVIAGMLAAAMVTGWAWAVMPLWLRVCSGIAGIGLLAAQYIWCEVERAERRSQ